MPLYYRRYELAGIVCAEPKVLKSKKTGVENCIYFPIAYNTKSGDQYVSSFYNIHIYTGCNAFQNARYITKGQNIFCTGDIHRETWTKEVGGTKRYEERVYFDCKDFRIISNKDETEKRSNKMERAATRKEQQGHKYPKEDCFTDDAGSTYADNLPEPEYETDNPDIPF